MSSMALRLMLHRARVKARVKTKVKARAKARRRLQAAGLPIRLLWDDRDLPQPDSNPTAPPTDNHLPISHLPPPTGLIRSSDTLHRIGLRFHTFRRLVCGIQGTFPNKRFRFI